MYKCNKFALPVPDISLLNAKIGQLKMDRLGVMVKREAGPQNFSYETAVEGQPDDREYLAYRKLQATV